MFVPGLVTLCLATLAASVGGSCHTGGFQGRDLTGGSAGGFLA
jgi:hypothetical protein